MFGTQDFKRTTAFLEKRKAVLLGKNKENQLVLFFVINDYRLK
jgi:hypothetical protein